MAQATGKGQAVGNEPAEPTAVDAINEALNLLTEEAGVNQDHAMRLAGTSSPQVPQQVGGGAANPQARSYEDGQMATIEDRIISLLCTLRYANERLSTVTQ